MANDVTEPGAGFDVDTNKVMFISRDGSAETLPLMSKDEVADRIIEEVERKHRDEERNSSAIRPDP